MGRAEGLLRVLDLQDSVAIPLLDRAGRGRGARLPRRVQAGDLRPEEAARQAVTRGHGKRRLLPLAGIAHGLASNLIERAADVCLKEGRRLVLCVRETPFNRIHIRNMGLAADAGATIYPVIPGFYQQPVSTDEMAKNFADRVLAFLGFPQEGARIWKPE